MHRRKNNSTHLKKCSSGDLKSHTFSADNLIWITGQLLYELDIIISGPLEAMGRLSLKTDSKAWALCRKPSTGRGDWKAWSGPCLWVQLSLQQERWGCSGETRHLRLEADLSPQSLLRGLCHSWSIHRWRKQGALIFTLLWAQVLHWVTSLMRRSWGSWGV